jgi:N-acylglucosamine 2-epimerase
LVSRDKFTWSQGRFAWLCARLARDGAAGLIPGTAKTWLAHAEKTVRFLERHAFLADGACAFLLSEEGLVKEAIPGRGPAPSIYADCFVVMGFAEYAAVSGERAVFDAAWRLFERIQERIATGQFATWPAPIPEGHDSHALAMIALNMTLVLADAAEVLADPRSAPARTRCQSAAARIFDDFMQADGRIIELRPRVEPRRPTLLSRHVNPGHSLEGLWMLLTVAQRLGDAAWVARAQTAIRYALETGWDAEHGGIFHFVDCERGPPTGEAGDSAYERNVRDTWSTKLWWVHSEALYTTALAHRVTGDPAMRAWFERIWEYAFRIFPQPDSAIGEWIQIRDRQGQPLERVVALPVKDPYHIARNLIQLTKLFHIPFHAP